ncbi:MAG: trypsin-like peptidase domain-containing protein [Oscillospiraceae bacterium]|nr:trypsin-like peptidase domain-containing protein [Oscillospiraceae bacterium]
MKRRLLNILLITIILVSVLTPGVPAAYSAATEAADELYRLGLFRGTNTGYELDRAPTRQEAIVMLIRLLGKENEAVNSNRAHGFSDVSLWADGYVSYAFDKELTVGYSETVFGSADDITAAQYITFVLRSLGYSEQAGDFSWRAPWNLSDGIGLTAGEYSAAGKFTRADAVMISYSALSVRLKGGDMTLLEYLEVTGALSSSGEAGLTATRISEMCSPAVFRLEVYNDDSYRNSVRLGSGFFIDGDGLAVTNYHVIKNTKSARVTLISGKSHNVSGVVYANEEEDLAILRVSKTSAEGDSVRAFPFLEMGSRSAVRNGDVIYTIGSPLGFQNSISNGIVSNSLRRVEGIDFIQITAPISGGSSGGALINDSGKVIGVTTAYFEDSQNMNLALPIDMVKNIDPGSVEIPYDRYFSTVTSNADYTLSASKTDITIRARSTERILIATDCPADDVSLEWDNSNNRAVYVEWGKWVDRYNAELFISGLRQGTSTVTVVYCDGTGSPDAKAVINVTVVS